MTLGRIGWLTSLGLVLLGELPPSTASAAALPVRFVAATVEPGAKRAFRPVRPKRRQRDSIAGGSHWRFVTERGAVHLWRPRGYDHRTAGTVIYVHGYFTDVDEAWEQHRLPEQFSDSGRNALFIAIESPVSNPDTVKWNDLAELFATVRAGGVGTPNGPVVVMAHSGGFRTVVPWLTSGLVDQVILLDALYNNLPDFDAWLKADEERNRIVVVGFETAARTEQSFLSGYSDALVRDAIPERFSEFTRGERHAKILYLRSQYGHMEIVTEGQVIPMMVRLAPLRPI